MAGRPCKCRPPWKIGLTGGAGVGKSSAAAFLARVCGGRYLDADQVCRELLRPRAKGWRIFKEAFGGDYLRADQTLDRDLLRRDIFRHEGLRHRLNELVHPLAREVILAQAGRRQPGGYLLNIVEVPLLFEAGWQKDFDRIVVIYADRRTCLERLMRRDNITRPAAETMLAAQWPMAEKILRADHVIDNNGSRVDTELQLLHLARLLLKIGQII